MLDSDLVDLVRPPPIKLIDWLELSNGSLSKPPFSGSPRPLYNFKSNKVFEKVLMLSFRLVRALTYFFEVVTEIVELEGVEVILKLLEDFRHESFPFD